MRQLTPLDRLLVAASTAASVIFGTGSEARPRPGPPDAEEPPPLSPQERREAGALMRVNHVGEVCAQALYTAQALMTRDPALREHHERAAREEMLHLAWTRSRVAELGGRLSLLNPLWYAGSFGIGLMAGRLGDRTSLGFVIETETQVEQHLASHLLRLPPGDTTSRAIVDQMRQDEARHAREAEDAGGVRPPLPVRWIMRAAAKVMTTTAHYL
jgi:ubiquinone biosynthesis monooxygenase Coq7